MEETLSIIDQISIFGFSGLPAFIIYVFILISILSIIISIFKKSVFLIVIIAILNILAWMGVFEIVKNI